MTRITSAFGPIRAAVGDELSIAVPGKVDGGQPPIAYSQQWHVNGRKIDGETGDVFVVRAQDDRKKITCVTTATDAIGRVLVLAPSNEIFIGQKQRKPEPDRICPPKQQPECPETPPIAKRTATAKPAKAVPQKKKTSANPSATQARNAQSRWLPLLR